MVDEKLAVFILDALGPQGLRQLEMPRLQELYRQNGSVATVSGIPHTAPSNALMFSGNEEKRFWLKVLDRDKVEEPVKSSSQFSRSDAAPKKDVYRCWRPEDFRSNFIWSQVNSVVNHLPITLPPVYVNCKPPDGDHWFPDTRGKVRQHVRSFVDRSTEILRDTDADLYISSCQAPDKWWHGAAEWNVEQSEAQQYIAEESKWLDNQIPDLIDAA
ncbi:MAG: hypothetical protein ABEJ66_00140, partial [Candidatus Nanohaloarchaea archaeon]